MSHDASKEINYWPAYVDALINVVLNLLFLVGVFTIALVSLNAQALFAEQEANRRKLAALDAARTQRERQQMVSQMLLSLPAESIAPDSRPKEKETQPKIEQPRISEIRLRAEITRDRQMEERQPTVENEKTAFTSVEQFIATLSNGGEIKRIEFNINQYDQPIDWSGLTDLKDRVTQKVWFLLVISDPRNPRLGREAFARLVSVRAALLKAGVASSNIQLKVTDAPSVIALPEGIERTVWVIEKNQ